MSKVRGHAGRADAITTAWTPMRQSARPENPVMQPAMSKAAKKATRLTKGPAPVDGSVLATKARRIAATPFGYKSWLWLPTSDRLSGSIQIRTQP